MKAQSDLSPSWLESDPRHSANRARYFFLAGSGTAMRGARGRKRVAHCTPHMQSKLGASIVRSSARIERGLL
jgi:hypothetical protein